MAEYIEREALKQHLTSYAGMFTDELGFAVSLEAVLNGIDFQPTADVVQVVRCRDCKSYCPESITVMKYCVLTGVSVDANDFCSYGERKDTDVH